MCLPSRYQVTILHAILRRLGGQQHNTDKRTNVRTCNRFCVCQRRNGRRALVGQLRQMGLVSAVAVGVGALLLRVSSR